MKWPIPKMSLVVEAVASPGTLDQAGVGAHGGRTEDPAIRVQCHLKEQDIDLRLCLTPNPLILSEVVEVEQSEKVLLEVAVGQPLTSRSAPGGRASDV